MRREDWLTRLWEQVASAESCAFAWGEHDCCLFAARCVDAMTGSEFVAALQAEYHDKPSALRFIVREGSLEAAITARMGTPVQWWKASRGDLCLMPTADGLGSLGVCMGPTVACVREDQGVEYLPADRALACWSVQ